MQRFYSLYNVQMVLRRYNATGMYVCRYLPTTRRISTQKKRAFSRQYLSIYYAFMKDRKQRLLIQLLSIDLLDDKNY